MELSHLGEKLRKSIEMFLKFVFKIPKNSCDKFITSKRVMKLNKNSTNIILMKYRIKNRLVKFQNVLVAVRMELRSVIIRVLTNFNFCVFKCPADPLKHPKAR